MFEGIDLNKIWEKMTQGETSLLQNKPIKLNLGCGTKLREGYINIDERRPITLLAKDFFIRGPVSPLSWIPDHSVDEILAEFVVEHLHQAEAMEAFYQWWRILKRGGQLRIIVPNALAISRSILDHDNDLVLLNSASGCLLASFLSSKGADAATPHRSLWTESALEKALTVEGYQHITTLEMGTRRWGLDTIALAGSKEGEEE